VGVFTVILFFYGGQNWIMLQVQEQLSPSNIQRRAIERQQKSSAAPSNLSGGSQPVGAA
jgi:hypothetical protein